MDYTGLSRLSYGLYILTTKVDEKADAMLASIAFQVSSDPTIVAISMSKNNLSNDNIEKTKKFNLSVLTVDAKLEFMGKFGFYSGRDKDKLEGVKTENGKNGIPVVTEGCSSYIECEVCGQNDLGANVVYFAKVSNVVVLGGSNPMTLEHYQKVLNGTISQNAPAYAARYVK